ncbi:MAG: helix-turn-helix transcriptional regulator [Myxococcales bacterium]|nr:helix-turn-helix transcriptional regulator [Myxococcales bacterium]
MPRSRDHHLLRQIGQRVAEARTARGYTQERLAEAVGIEPVTLSRWETGHRAVSISTLAVIADTLGVGLGDLLDVTRALPSTDYAPDESALLRGYRALTDARRDLVRRLVRELAP